jgi:hypothetical protein
VTDLATACLHFKTAKMATLLNPDDMSLREPLKHTRWRLQQLSIVDYLRMVEQAHAEVSARRDAVAEDRAQQQHDDEAKPGIDAIAVDQSAAVPAGNHPSPQRKESKSVPDRGHSARRPRSRRDQ